MAMLSGLMDDQARQVSFMTGTDAVGFASPMPSADVWRPRAGRSADGCWAR